MVQPKIEGANPIVHLISRQVGNNIDNFRRNLFRERLANARNLFRKNLVSHYGCVNAIEFSSKGDLLTSGGDDRRVLLWKLEEAMAGVSEPYSMKNQHYSNIFCLGFNNDSTKIFSGGNDEAVIVHDVNTGEPYDVFLHSKPVYGLSVDVTNDQIFATAGDDGHILIFDLRIGTQVLTLPKSRAPFHAVQFHPSDGNCMITGNGKDGAALWDLRDYNQPIIRYDGGKDTVQSCMSVRFNTHGTQVLALRRRLPPILYNTLSQDPICQFYHPDYYNSCTMKSCSFAGVSDEYVISGSDDFNLYMWRVNDADCEKKNQWIDTHHMVLYGHRSVVNQVRYNAQKCILASSGVEKIIKIWRPFELDDWTGSLTEEPNGPTNARDIFSHEEYVSLLNSSGQNMTHDYSHQSTVEDPRMMAFFDSLVQREIEGWNSNENSDSDKSSLHSSDGSSRRTSTLQSESDETFQVYGRDSMNHNRGTMKSRSRYLNRIAYLIATKRNTLKRLALKGSGHTTRRVKSLKCNSRKLHRSSYRQPRKSKRINRLNARTKSRDCNGNNSESELPKKLAAKRRQQLHFNVPSYRTNRRVNKSQTKTFFANYESGDSSSDDENLSDNNNSLPSSSKAPTSQETANSNNRNDANESESAATFPIPSTSTGITSSNGTLFRIVQSPDNSDDEPTPENSPAQPSQSVNHVATIKINGTHAPNTTRTYSSGVDDEQPNETRHSRRKRNHSMTTTNYHYTHYSSHSSSRLSDSSSSDDDDTTSNDSSAPFFSNNLIKKPKQSGNEATSVQQTEEIPSILTRLERTPLANRSRDAKSYELTPDSGIASTPGSSTSSATQSTSIPSQRKSSSSFISSNENNANNDDEDDDDEVDIDDNHNNRSCNGKVSKVNRNDAMSTSIKLYQQSVLRVRRNFRNIGDVSYSEDSE